MDVREKLVELLTQVAVLGDYLDMRKVADHLIAHGVTVSEGALPVADAATERSAAVDKIEDQRKPEDFIGNRKPVQEWISVKDRLPPPYTPVLTYRQSFGKNPPYTKVDQMVLLYGDDKVWTDDLGTWKTVVTHWMPLPQPPKGE